MANVFLVTDSTADLSDEMVDEIGVRVIPLTVTIDGKDYLDRQDISNLEIYEHLKVCEELPKTSQPSPSDFIEMYRACKEAGADAVISMHLSEELSGAVNGARLAADQLKDEIPVHVFDSRTATLGLGIQVYLLSKFMKKTTDLQMMLNYTQDIIENTAIYFLLGSLDNLSKGGRIGKAGYLIGSLLGIKPTLLLRDGVIQVHDKIRTTKNEKAIRHLLDVREAQIAGDKSTYWALGYNNMALLDAMYAELDRRGVDYSDYLLFELGSVVSIHIGLDAVGFVMVQPKGEYSNV